MKKRDKSLVDYWCRRCDQHFDANYTKYVKHVCFSKNDLTFGVAHLIKSLSNLVHMPDKTIALSIAEICQVEFNELKKHIRRAAWVKKDAA